MCSKPHHVELQGHRGARGVLPENTLPGFRHAIAAGCDSLELDIAMTRDGELVISHDPALNTDITRKDGVWIEAPVSIKTLTAGELQAFDVGRLRPGSAFARRFPRQQPLDGLQIPLLMDLLSMPEVQRNERVIIDIEIKTSPLDPAATFPPEAIADVLVKTIDKSGIGSRVRVRSFDWRSLAHLKRGAPGLPLACLTAARSFLDNLEIGRPGHSPWLAGIDIDALFGSAVRAAHQLGGRIWAPYYRDIDQVELDLAHKLGLRVIAWTVNDEADMRRLIAMGVDGLTTDYPELGRRIIDEMKPR